jgi:hypothetical protein
MECLWIELAFPRNAKGMPGVGLFGIFGIFYGSNRSIKKLMNI